MDKNIKGFLFVAAIVLLIASFGAASASDVDGGQTSVAEGTTQSSDIQTAEDADAGSEVQTTTKEAAADNSKTQTTAEDADTISTDKQSATKTSSSSIAAKTDSKKSLKTAQTHVVTNKTIGDIFYIADGQTGLADAVSDGDTLDFQGTINLTGTSLIINKPVNIISSTHDSKICLNTQAGSLFGEDPGASFVINNGGSYSNITGINLYNTQLWVYNTTRVTFDNISAVVEDARVGSGVGQTSIRQNSSYITLKNSLISTKDNGGSSSFVLAWANYCTIDNCTVKGIGNVGNIVYLTTFNIEIPSGAMYNSYNNITNNVIIGPSEPQPICIALALTGANNLIENNTVYYNGSGFGTQVGQATRTNHTYKNNVLIGSASIGMLPNSTAVNNTLAGQLALGVNSMACNNTAGSLSLASNSIAENNIVQGSVSFGGADATLKNSIVSGTVTISSANAIIKNNIISGAITINSKGKTAAIANNTIANVIEVKSTGCLIENNTIVNNKAYTVNIARTARQNTVKNNYLVAAAKIGDDSINGVKTVNTVQDNAPTESPIETIITIDCADTTINKTTTVNFTLIDKNGAALPDKTINIQIGNEIKTITTNATGQAQYDYMSEYASKKSIAAAYDGDANYIGSQASATFAVNKLNANIILDDVTATYGDKITLTAALKDSKGNLINGGKAAFKINGKTLKDANGNVIYAQVADGVATITIDGIYSAKGYTISVVYSGNSIYASQRANSTLTITSKNPAAMAVTPSTYTPTQGETITVTVEVSDGSTKISTGKAILKLNGVSLRDSNGNVIYGYVKNGKAQITVKIPASMKANMYNLTAVYNGKNYNRTEASANVTIIAKP